MISPNRRGPWDLVSRVRRLPLRVLYGFYKGSIAGGHGN